jgi:hypothetical protein
MRRAWYGKRYERSRTQRSNQYRLRDGIENQQQEEHNESRQAALHCVAFDIVSPEMSIYVQGHFLPGDDEHIE